MPQTKLYHDYDQQALDAQYDNRAAVPDFQRYFDRWASESQVSRKDLGGELDITYGPDAANRLDILAPAHAAGAPVFIFIHGGYWRSLSKEDFSFVARGLVKAGVLTVLVEYGLCPRVQMGQLFGHCRRALDWVRQNIGRFGGDSSRIFIGGHSAGGHLTAMLCCPDPTSPDPPCPVAGAWAISGIYDLEPIRLSFLQSDLDLNSADVERFSPLRQARRTSTPLTLFVGGLERPEFHRQMDSFAGAWERVGNSGRSQSLDNLQHFSVLDEFLDSEAGPILGSILRRIREIQL